MKRDLRVCFAAVSSLALTPDSPSLNLKKKRDCSQSRGGVLGLMFAGYVPLAP